MQIFLKVEFKNRNKLKLIIYKMEYHSKCLGHRQIYFLFSQNVVLVLRSVHTVRLIVYYKSYTIFLGPALGGAGPNCSL